MSLRSRDGEHHHPRERQQRTGRRTHTREAEHARQEPDGEWNEVGPLAGNPRTPAGPFRARLSILRSARHGATGARTTFTSCFEPAAGKNVGSCDVLATALPCLSEDVEGERRGPMSGRERPDECPVEAWHPLQIVERGGGRLAAPIRACERHAKPAAAAECEFALE